MRLVTRLTIGFLVVVILTISLNEYRQLGAAREDYEQDMDRTHQLLATTLAGTVALMTERDGLDAALAAVLQANQGQNEDVRIRWVCVPGRLDSPAPPIDCANLTATVNATEGERRFTFSPVRINGALDGAIEVSEPPDHEGQWQRVHFDQAVVLALMTIGAMTAAAFVLGWWLVARPTRALREKARAVGRGELLPDLKLQSQDELSEVADEMNAMCRQLGAATERANEATAKLRHADRLATVGRIASGLAHELGTPLNVIETRATLMIDDPNADPALQKSARVIVECADQMTRLVKELLVFARPRKLELAQTPLDGLARSVVEMLTPVAARKGVQLEVKGETHRASNADAVLLQQAVTNLVVNAVNACESGGHVTLVTAETSATRPGANTPSEWCTLSVVDDGVGMTDQVKASIFEPFFTTRPPGEGTGLGMPIVASILEDHGGFLSVQSAPGKGSTMTIHLPIAGAAESGR
ncbi:MAG: HAMP domain-containing sensor histidine kinase [Myxococcaceae bacterium]